MVSAHRSADGGGGPDSVVHHHQYGGPLLLTAAVDASTLAEDPNKKIRKPYTITKSRESWTEQEHDKFLEALQLFDRDWKKIEAFVGSKTVIQIRSHAQKYFLKVQKNGTSEHVPPPRPKRKAAHPYPQKASKNTLPLSQSTVPFQSSSCLHEPGYALRTETSSGLRNSASSGQVSSWARGTIQPVSASQMTKEDVGPAGVSLVNNCCSSSSTESHSRICLTGEATDQGNDIPSLHVMPDFAQVYSFIGSIFDPGTSGHLEKLREMDPIDVETVLLLMRNLSVNLTSPDFEDHVFSYVHIECGNKPPQRPVLEIDKNISPMQRRLLSLYDTGKENTMSISTESSLDTDETVNAPFMAKGE